MLTFDALIDQLTTMRDNPDHGRSADEQAAEAAVAELFAEGRLSRTRRIKEAGTPHRDRGITPDEATAIVGALAHGVEGWTPTEGRTTESARFGYRPTQTVTEADVDAAIASLVNLNN
ncbi:hypothetical protein [Brevibacterium moorei]|uniref:hypothetical protein n=1 Tax=Brevibacterium moorei TaxID=2968457 RepID=UPI00211C8CD7|nr:hypothetical protein [Brevibacterium sp. 68QC2CO]MCQ9386808.1 hypothetical protein [Brevibacterium sp. 68QC2CO]